MSETTKMAVDRYAEAWVRRDAGLLAASLAPDATLFNPRLGELAVARILAHLEALLQGFPDLAFEIEGPIIAEGPRAAYRWVMTGTNLGGFYGRPPTGHAVRLPGADFVEVADGRVRRVIEYSDTAGFAEQLAAQS